MNKILFLKGLIVVLTLLIFLALGGIVYALINYKTTPKLIPRKDKVEASIPATSAASAVAPKKVVTRNTEGDVFLAQDKETSLRTVSNCGNLICVSVTHPFNGDKVAVIDPHTKSVFWISIRGESLP